MTKFGASTFPTAAADLCCGEQDAQTQAREPSPAA